MLYFTFISISETWQIFDFGYSLVCRSNVRRDYGHGNYVDGGDVLLTRSTTVADEGKSDLNGHNRVPLIFFFFLEGENRGSFPSHSDDRCVRNLSIIFQKWWPFSSITFYWSWPKLIVHSWSLSANFSFKLRFSKPQFSCKTLYHYVLILIWKHLIAKMLFRKNIRTPLLLPQLI